MMPAPLDELDGRLFDVAIIGGGINGASAAQQLTAAGYSVILAEKADFGSGATSRSSRLLHCGLRYFETPRPIRYFLSNPVRLVEAIRMARQAMRARHEFVRTSPDRTRPLTLAFPLYEGGPFAPWQFDLGFALLRKLAPSDPPLNYRRRRPSEARDAPFVGMLRDPDSLRSVVTFTEYQLDWPERICADLVLDAERMGAVVRNYTWAALVEFDGFAWTIEITDSDDARRQARIRANAVLNAAGCWADSVTHAISPSAGPTVSGTKGAHIVVKLPDQFRGHGIATTNSLHEPFYCLPWHDLHYIGPTETPFHGDHDFVAADRNDVDFLLAETRRTLPGLSIERGDVLYTWAGVRPLTYDPSIPGGKRARTLHDLEGRGLPRAMALTAGPVMTHRSAGREIVDRLRQILTPSNPPQALNYRPPAATEPTDSRPAVDGLTDVTLGHIREFAANQHARTLMDVLSRRSGLGWRHQFTQAEIQTVALAMASELGWSSERRHQEINRFNHEVERLFSVPGIPNGTVPGQPPKDAALQTADIQ